MSNHTPAPWAWNGPPENIHVTRADNPDMRVCFLTSDGPTEANARLIAAAPEMLEALQYADIDFEAMGYSPDHSVRKHIIIAIAKAEGK